MSETLDEDVYRTLLTIGTATINQLASILKRKHETVDRAVRRLEENGRVNVIKDGRTRYVTLRPSPVTKRVRPASTKPIVRTGDENEVYARTSCISRLMRAKTVSERVTMDGFVLHPETKGCDIGREWVRVHVNGEYQVTITKVGDFRSYNRDDDVAVKWTQSYLNTNKAYNGKIFLKGTDTRAYSVRAVESKDGSLSVLSVWIHPRDVYHTNHESTALEEFRQQVKDVCDALITHEWGFNFGTISLNGELHTAINDPLLGSQVGRYNQTPGDDLHYDHSHGIPECEVYGSDPDTVELMVNLPTVIRSMSESLEQLTKLMDSVIAIQTKTVSMFIPNTNNQNDVMFR